MIRAELTSEQRVELLLHLDILRDEYAALRRHSPKSQWSWWEDRVESVNDLYEFFNALWNQPDPVRPDNIVEAITSLARCGADCSCRGTS